MFRRLDVLYITVFLLHCFFLRMRLTQNKEIHRPKWKTIHWYVIVLWLKCYFSLVKKRSMIYFSNQWSLNFFWKIKNKILQKWLWFFLLGRKNWKCNDFWDIKLIPKRTVYPNRYESFTVELTAIKIFYLRNSAYCYSIIKKKKKKKEKLVDDKGYLNYPISLVWSVYKTLCFNGFKH